MRATICASMNLAKFDALDHYHASSLFTEGERAAPDPVTTLAKEKKHIQKSLQMSLNIFLNDRYAKLYI